MDAATPNPAGGLEAYISEGYARVDIPTAQDDDTTHLVAPVLAYVVRHLHEASLPVGATDLRRSAAKLQREQDDA